MNWFQNRTDQKTAAPSLKSLRRGLQLFYAITLILIIGTIAWSSYTEYEQTLETQRHSSISLAHSLDEHASRSFISVEQAMQNIAEDLERSGGIAVMDEKQAHLRLQEKVRLTPQIRAIIAIDQNGILRAHGLEYPTRHVNLADRSYYAYHRNNKDQRPLIDIPLISRTDGQWLIPVTRRINRADGSFGGIILSGVEPVYFLQFYDSLKLGRGTRVQILRNDGTVLLTYPFDKARMGANLRDQNPARYDEAIKKANITEGGAFLNLEAEARFEVFQANQAGLPFSIRISTDKQFIFQKFEENTTSRIASAIGLILVITILLYLLMRQISRVEEVESRLYLTQFSVDEAPDMVIWCGRSGQLRYCNHTLIAHTHHSREELLQQRIIDLFHISATDWLKLVETLRSEPRQQTESHLNILNDRPLPVELTFTRIEFGTDEYICVTARDISERKEAEYELRRHRDHLQDMVSERTAEIRTVLDASPLAIVMSVRGQIRLVNPAFSALFGHDADNIIGAPEFTLFGTPGHYAELQPQIRAQIVANRGIYRCEVELQRADQSSFWAMMFIKALTPDEPDRGVISIIEDITAQRISAQTLRQSERLKRTIIDTTADAFVLIDAHEHIVDTNQAFCQLLQVSRDNTLGRTLNELMGEQAQQLFPALQKTAPGEAHIEEITLQTDERSHPFLANSGVICNEQHELEYRFLFLTDIEHLKEIERSLMKAKEDAEAANMAKSVFLANMSHELRTPMHAILSFSEMGVDKLGKTEEANIKRYFERIQSSGNRLLVLLNDLLDMSRLEANKMNYNRSRHRLQSTVRAAVAEIGPLLAQKKLTLDVNETNQLMLVYDRERMIQVVVNLLSNAIKFGPEGTRIHIQFIDDTLLPDGRAAAGFSVRDEGAGIPEEDLEAIFDKFIQSKRMHSASGTGLGLSICRQIMQDHDGLIAAGNHPQGGAVFTVLLPVEQAEAAKLP